VLFESITDDNFFSTVPYIMDKGFTMNRVGYEYQVSDKLTVNAAAMYMMTAEDIEYTVGSEEYSDDSIGFEFDAGVSYKLYKSLTLSAQVGYLMADDALDYYEVDSDGNSDEDIYVINSGLRYKF
jgi:predicted porin